MSDVVIRCEGLGKRYRVGSRAPYHRMSELLVSAAMAPWRALTHVRNSQNSQNELEAQKKTARDDGYFWALKDLSFEINKGDIVGVIGRNGAGKSTLFKLLSRITEPSAGQAETIGRVGSLLEVGTGFHPELTGRENVYLNGAILGMSRREVQSQFDEIIAFAEVEKFVDTPVKRYSSGMHTRLAFAVAAHLNPEILIVDEVLAVGDAKFQKKCLGRISEISKTGRTVLFVSHSMPAVQSLCEKAMVLSAGKMIYLGDIKHAVELYEQASDVPSNKVDLTQGVQRTGDGAMKLKRFWIEDASGKPLDALSTGQSCVLAVEYESADGEPKSDVSMSIHFNASTGLCLSLVNMNMLNQIIPKAPPKGVILLRIPRLPLAAGRYVVDLNLSTHGGQTYSDFIKSAVGLDVADGDFYGTGRSSNTGAAMMIDASWEVRA